MAFKTERGAYTQRSIYSEWATMKHISTRQTCVCSSLICCWYSSCRCWSRSFKLSTRSASCAKSSWDLSARRSASLHRTVWCSSCLSSSHSSWAHTDTHPGADLTGGHSCSGRRGPWEAGPWRTPGLGGPGRLNFGLQLQSPDCSLNWIYDLFKLETSTLIYRSVLSEF